MANQIDIKSTTTITCEECKCEYFVEAIMLRKASRLMTGAAQDQVIQIPTLRCADCGNVNKDFKIKEL